MSPRFVCVLVGMLLMGLSFGLGFRWLMAQPFLLSTRQKVGRLAAGLGTALGLFLIVGAFFYVPAQSEETPAGKEAGVSAPAPARDVGSGDASGPGKQASSDSQAQEATLTWTETLAPALEAARKAGRPLLVDCWAAWCKPCKKLFEDVLSHPSLRDRMSRFVLVKLDTEAEANATFVEQQAIGDDLPWVGFLASDGKLMPGMAFSGEKGAEPFSSPEEFGKVLDDVLGKNPLPAGTTAKTGSDGTGTEAATTSKPPPAQGTEATDWLTSLPEGFAQAAKEGKPLLVDEWAVWCTSCLDLKHTTFPDKRVTEALAGYVAVALDMDAPESQEIWDRYGIKGLPWVARFEPGEEVHPTWVLSGYEAPEPFANRLVNGAEEDSIAAWLAGKGLLLTLLLVFLAGIAASLTPCAYPTYFLVLGFFTSGKEDENRGVRSGLLAAAVIVLGMMLSYSAAGLAAALGGGAVGRVMTNPWVMGAIAVLFVFMGAQSLAVLPPMEFSALKSALHSRQKQNLLWALVFGLVMGLVVAPCVGPILIGILTYVATEGNMALGVLLMATFALGMGVLLFLTAAFSQAIRSRISGGWWSEFITVLFGIIFFAAALYYLKGVLPYEALFGLLSGF